MEVSMWHSWGSALGIVAFVAACSRSGAPVPSEARVPAALDVHDVPSASPPSASSEVARTRPSPSMESLQPMESPSNLTDPEQQDQFRVLSTLCRPAVVETSPKHPAVGCACCPPFADCKPIAGQTVSNDKDSFYEANSVVHGSFTAAGRDEVAVSMNGCESHAANYGGLVVAERNERVFRLVRYDSGIHPDTMKAYRLADGHDLLVCDWIDSHQTVVERLFTRDLERTDEKLDPLYEVGDNVTMACLGLPPGDLAHASRIDDFSFEDANGDGIKDLRVRVHIAVSAATPAFKAKCKQLFAALDADAPRPDFANVMKSKDRVVWFLSDGKKFSPKP
jgi:hypothetical protein